MLERSLLEYYLHGFSSHLVLLFIFVNGIDGASYSSSETDTSTIYPATLAGIILGGIIVLIIIVVVAIIVLQICCKSKNRRDRRRIMAARDWNVADADGVRPFFPNPVPPPAYDSLYPTPTDGSQSARSISSYPPWTPPPPYSQTTTTHI